MGFTDDEDEQLQCRQLLFLSDQFPTDTLVNVCSFLSLSELSNLDRAVTNRSHRGRLALLEAFFLLPLKLDFGVVKSAIQAVRFLVYAISRFDNVREVIIRFAMTLSVPSFSKFSKLEKLLVKNPYLCKLDLMTVGTSCSSLRSLSILTPYSDEGSEGPAIMTELRHFSSLAELTLEGSDRLDDSCLQAIAEGCRVLQSLTIQSCNRVSAAGVRQLCERCSTLTALDLSECADLLDDDVVALSDSLPGLRSLTLGGQRFLTNASVQYLLLRPEGGALLHLSLPRCSSLDLSSDTGLLASTRCKDRLADLHSLDLSDIETVDDASVQALGLFCGQGLLELRMLCCPRLTDAIAAVLESAFRSLRQVRLTVGSAAGSSLTVAALEGLEISMRGRLGLAQEAPRCVLVDLDGGRVLDVLAQVEEDYDDDYDDDYDCECCDDIDNYCGSDGSDC